MQQIMAVWQALDTRRRIVVAGATALMFAAILAISGVAARPDMALLYAGLEGAQAGDIITALDQRAVHYEVRGDSIYVDAAKRDELRMALASEGLPATGGAGYELLDSLSGFGTTSQMFDAAYWRAKEGELARTIVSNPMIRSARVHIAVPSGQSFRKETHPTASVTVTMNSGGLSPTNAKALKYLVASAVAGMAPDDVSVIDSAAGLVSTGDDAISPAAQDRAEGLRKNVERLLEARVGYGNAVVEVSLTPVTEREAITERKIEPDSRVAISTDTEETSNKSDNTKSGAVSVASNLPDGNAANSGKSQSQSAQTRERTNYEVSETTRELVRNPGDIKRLTVAVLVDGVEGKDANGNTTIVPRSEEELASLKELVASAVGFDEARGDVITLRSMAFQPIAETGTAAHASLLGGASVDVMQLAKVVLLAIVALVLGLFVMRPIFLQRASSAVAGLPAPAEGATAVLTGEIADDTPDTDSMALVPDFNLGELPMMGNAFGDDVGDADPVSRLRKLIEERQAESVEILRNWMGEKEERA